MVFESLQQCKSCAGWVSAEISCRAGGGMSVERMMASPTDLSGMVLNADVSTEFPTLREILIPVKKRQGAPVFGC
eukprot:s744_g29.t1